MHTCFHASDGPRILPSVHGILSTEAEPVHVLAVASREGVRPYRIRRLKHPREDPFVRHPILEELLDIVAEGLRYHHELIAVGFRNVWRYLNPPFIKIEVVDLQPAQL